MSPVALEEARDPRRFGGKAVSLGAALRAALPVPGGLALGVDLVEALAERADAAIRELMERLRAFGSARVAVRSSAPGEDSAEASFAGQHLTVLNVAGPDAIAAAVRQVWASARAPSALAYRRRLGIAGEPRIGVVVQEMVVPTCAGVMFTRNPLTGADERVIEATWGLGEAVVSGLVIPDRWRLAPDGAILAHEVGHKDLEITCAEGGTQEREVPPARAAAPCLDGAALAALAGLAAECERHFEGPSDIEFAFARGRVSLLQRRPITR